MRKIHFLLFVAGILFLSTACSSYKSFYAEKGYAEYLESPQALSVEKKSTSGSVELTLLMPQDCGCYLEKVDSRKEIKEDVQYQCIGISLSTDNFGKELKQKAKDNHAKPLSYYVFESFGSLTKTCLERQLGVYFNQVNIKTETTNQENSVISYYPKWGIPADRYILVKLIAKSSDGKIIEGNSQILGALGNGHAGWYFPVSILTFPIGYVIATSILYNMHDNLLNRMIAEAIDTAAAELSKKLADELAQNPNQQFNLYVMLE